MRHNEFNIIHNYGLVYRVYYHSRSNLPLTSEEIEVDSEEELQTLEWQNISSQKVRGRLPRIILRSSLSLFL